MSSVAGRLATLARANGGGDDRRSLWPAFEGRPSSRALILAQHKTAPPCVVLNQIATPRQVLGLNDRDVGDAVVLCQLSFGGQRVTRFELPSVELC